MDVIFIYYGFALFEGTIRTTKPFQLTGNLNVSARDVLQYLKNNVVIQLFRVNKQATARNFMLFHTYL